MYTLQGQLRPRSQALKCTDFFFYRNEAKAVRGLPGSSLLSATLERCCMAAVAMSTTLSTMKLPSVSGRGERGNPRRKSPQKERPTPWQDSLGVHCSPAIQED